MYVSCRLAAPPNATVYSQRLSATTQVRLGWAGLGAGVPAHRMAMDAGYAALDILSAIDGQGLAFDADVRVPEEAEAWIPPEPAPHRWPRPHPHPRLLPAVYRVDVICVAIPEDLGRIVTYREGTAGRPPYVQEVRRSLTRHGSSFGPQEGIGSRGPQRKAPGRAKFLPRQPRGTATARPEAQAAMRVLHPLERRTASCCHCTARSAAQACK